MPFSEFFQSGVDEISNRNTVRVENGEGQSHKSLLFPNISQLFRRNSHTKSCGNHFYFFGGDGLVNDGVAHFAAFHKKSQGALIAGFHFSSGEAPQYFGAFRRRFVKAACAMKINGQKIIRLSHTQSFRPLYGTGGSLD